MADLWKPMLGAATPPREETRRVYRRPQLTNAPIKKHAGSGGLQGHRPSATLCLPSGLWTPCRSHRSAPPAGFLRSRAWPTERWGPASTTRETAKGGPVHERGGSVHDKVFAMFST